MENKKKSDLMMCDTGDDFVVVRKKAETRTHMKVLPETYAILSEWSAISGWPLVQLCADAVRYAAAHVRVINSDQLCVITEDEED